MIFPQPARFTDVALLLLRLMVGVVFVTSGCKHLKDPETRSKDIEVSKSFAIFLGAAELAGGLGVISGVFAPLAAIGLMLLMPGAQRKIFAWHSGFWGKSGTSGWSYETMLVAMNLVIVTTGGGTPLSRSPVQVRRLMRGRVPRNDLIKSDRATNRRGVLPSELRR
jgi:putative oxidoreductase